MALFEVVAFGAVVATMAWTGWQSWKRKKTLSKVHDIASLGVTACPEAGPGPAWITEDGRFHIRQKKDGFTIEPADGTSFPNLKLQTILQDTPIGDWTRQTTGDA